MDRKSQLQKEIAHEEALVSQYEAELANDHFLQHLSVPASDTCHAELQTAIRRFSFTQANQPNPNQYVLTGFFADYKELQAEITITDLGDQRYFAVQCRLLWESSYFDWLNFETPTTETVHYSLNMWIERVADYLDFDRQRRLLVAHPQVETQHEQAFTVVQIPIIPQPRSATAEAKENPEESKPLVLTWQFGGILRMAEVHPGLAQTDLDQLVITCKNDVEQTLDLLITQCTGTFKDDILNTNTALNEKYRYSPSGRRRGDYEVQRFEKIERNETMLNQLGLGGAGANLDFPGLENGAVTLEMSPAAIAEAAMDQASTSRKKAAKKQKNPKAKKSKGEGSKDSATEAKSKAAKIVTKDGESKDDEGISVAAISSQAPAAETIDEAAAVGEAKNSNKKSPPRKRLKESPITAVKTKGTDKSSPVAAATQEQASSQTVDPKSSAETLKKDGRMTLRTSGRRLPKQSSEKSAAETPVDEPQGAPPGQLSLKKPEPKVTGKAPVNANGGKKRSAEQEKTKETRKKRSASKESIEENTPEPSKTSTRSSRRTGKSGHSAAKSLLKLADGSEDSDDKPDAAEDNGEMSTEDEQVIMQPKKPAKKNADGTFRRPNGPTPKGYEWDAEQGFWMRP